MRTTDNNQGIEINEAAIRDFSKIANTSLENLAKNYPNLLIFPNSLGEHGDEIEKSNLFNIEGKNLTTQNCMGFVSSSETQLHISSRFYSENNDYFLHYMLQKVFKINILDFNISSQFNENVWDIFLLYLFPHYLKMALHQGLFKEYQQKEYNNANVKGVINVAKHIRQNIPFMGNIAYEIREHTYDNRITQLIRHTIEYIKNHHFRANVLHNDFETKQAVIQINAATATYNRLTLQKIIQVNRKAITHSFFTAYEPLRKICLQILRKEGLNFEANENEKVYGIVFDGAWLWEEYLNTFLSKDFIHTENKRNKNGVPVFKNHTLRYPDFYNKNMVLDAKYKRLQRNPNRDDLHQIITYMYILGLKKGAFIYPYEKENLYKEIGILNGFGGNIHDLGLKIERKCDSFQAFIKEMKENEEIMLSVINVSF